MNTKTCSKCHRELPFDNFNARTESADGLQARCKDCLREVRRAWYQSHQKDEYVRVKARGAKQREWWAQFKTTLKCSRCPETHPACVEFHHLVPSEKDINLAQVVQQGWGRERIEKEITKCIVLCANCHRKLHFEEKSVVVP